MPGPAPSTNTNNSELNSLDSGIPEEIPSGVRTKQGVIMLSQCNVRHILFIIYWIKHYLRSLPPPSTCPTSLPLLRKSPSLLNLEMPPNIKDQRSIHKQLLTLTTDKRFLTHMHTLQITKSCSTTSQDAFKTTQLF